VSRSCAAACAAVPCLCKGMEGGCVKELCRGLCRRPIRHGTLACAAVPACCKGMEGTKGTEPAGTHAPTQQLGLSIGPLESDGPRDLVTLPADATVDDLIERLPCPAGCAGFFVGRLNALSSLRYDDDSDEETLPVAVALVQRLMANGGVLLEPGKALSSYGIDSTSCSGIRLFAAYAEEERQPTVLKKDLDEAGFGENVLKYVKLHKEDKELITARRYFRAPLLPWLQKDSGNDSGLSQSVVFSMQDDFDIDVLRKMLTVQISTDGDGLQAACTNLAGDPVCTVKLVANDILATLRSRLCDKLGWSSAAFWDGTESVPESSCVARHTSLTAQQAVSLERASGCYQRHESQFHPAGYSASGTSSADLLALEPGRAGLQCHFKGDYKRAEELRRLVMTDAWWSIEPLDAGTYAVRIAGKARLDRFFAHERTGYERERLERYECHAMVTVPLEQLVRAQSAEMHHHVTTEGSGWSCGSGDYKCQFFLPTCLLRPLRSNEDDAAFILRGHLNREGSPDYPYHQMASYRRMWGEDTVLNISRHTPAVIRHFREALAGKSAVDMDEIVRLQASAPTSEPSEEQ